MATQTIGNPVLSASALRSVNFFNGRLLTGDDLREEQSTLQARLQRLGRAAGEGIAYGLEVQETGGSSSRQNPVVTIAEGLAVSRSGVALELPSAVDVMLARGAPVQGSEPDGLFADCQPYTPGTYTAGAGVYLLTIGPAEQGEGLAPVNGLGNQKAVCNVASSIETVQFRLIRLALAPSELNDKEHLRNRVAYQCFAPEALAGFTSDPFGTPPDSYGLIDDLRAQTLSDNEVPLAVIGWSIDDGIQFVDLWSVRRRLTRHPGEGEFAPFAGDRRRAEGEAMFLQFQAQVQDLLLRETDPFLLNAQNRFEHLPPAGLLPLRTSRYARGFDQVIFFQGITSHDPVFLEGARLDYVLRTAFEFPPIDLSSGGEAVRLYLVRENEMLAPGEVAPQPYLVLANGHVPYGGDARYDLSFWDYANYAER